MDFDWWTFAVQIVNFLILVWLLHRFLYRPVRAIIEQRRESAEQAERLAGIEKEKAEAARREYEARLAEAEERRSKLLAEANAQIAREREIAMDKVAVDARRLIADARGTLARERRAALADLQTEILRIAADMAGRILEQSGAEGETVAAGRLAERIDALPERDRRRLIDAVAETGAKVTVTTARPLDRSGRATWRRKLAELVGGKTTVEFDTDPDLLGGARLQFPDGVLDCSWKSELQDLARLGDGDEKAS